MLKTKRRLTVTQMNEAIAAGAVEMSPARRRR